MIRCKALAFIGFLIPSVASASDARMSYQNLGGDTAVLGLSVPVCSVSPDGTPQVCNLSGVQMNPADYYTKADTQDLFATIANYESLLNSVNALTASFNQEVATRQSDEGALLSQASAAATYATQKALADEVTARQSNDSLLMPIAGGAFTGPVSSVTPETGDNSGNIATTAFVNNSFSAIDSVVNGDISTAGSSLSVTLPNENVIITLAYTGSGSASITYYATTGTVAPVDIRRVTIWGGSAVETFTADNSSLTTSGTVVDSTIYTASNDSSAHFIRVNGHIYIITVWISANGARASMMYHRAI